jgi:hypothetical protein
VEYVYAATHRALKPTLGELGVCRTRPCRDRFFGAAGAGGGRACRLRQATHFSSLQELLGFIAQVLARGVHKEGQECPNLNVQSGMTYAVT